MKTINIFRMLLVVAALLMGANNVKAAAVETQLWPTDGGTNTTPLSYEGLNVSALTSLDAGNILRIYFSSVGNQYTSQWSFEFDTNNNQQFAYYSGNGTSSLIDEQYIDIRVAADKLTYYQSGFIIKGQNATISKIVLYTPDSTPLEVGNHIVWQSENSSGITLNDSPGLAFSTNIFYRAKAGDKVRLYGTTTSNSTGWRFNFQCGGQSIHVSEWNNGGGLNYYSGTALYPNLSGENGYVEFTLDNTTLADFRKDMNAYLYGSDFYAKSIIIIVTNSDTPPAEKANVTLAFNNPTTVTTVGTNITNVATATSNGNTVNVTITYTSSDQSVATVSSTGEVTPLKAGTTTITASFGGNNEYNPATSVSYTLTVNKNNVTISNAPVSLTFGNDFTGPTTSPANLPLTYSSSSNSNVAVINNGTVIPVGAGETTISVSFAGDNNYNSASGSYTLTITAPTRTGAVWNGAAWLGNYTIDGVGTHPQIPTANLKSAQIGDNIRFYGKLGPLSTTDWRVEVHGNPWDNQLGDPSGNDSFTNGYFDLPITGTNIGMLMNTDNLTLNGYNLTITAVELIPSGVPAKQNVTLSFTSATATATMGETDFLIPILIATVNNQTVTNLNISYESSDTDVATVDSSTGDITLVGPGITTITASFSGNDDYNAAQSASYRLTVLEAAPSEDDYIDVYANDESIGLYGYRTYVTEEAVDFSHSIGVEGYYATGLNTDGTEVQFTQITGICPAGVPLLLKAKSNATGTYKLLKATPSASATATAPSPNKLKAGTGNEVKGANKYVLTIHSEAVVFAEVNYNGAQVDSKHAYLDLNNTNAARGRLAIKLIGESTGISNIEAETIGDDVIYNLRGQRVENPTKGLYIINGKKVVIK